MVLCCRSLFLTADWYSPRAVAMACFLISQWQPAVLLLIHYYTECYNILVSCLSLNLSVIFSVVYSQNRNSWALGKCMHSLRVLPDCFSEKLPHFSFSPVIHEGVSFPISLPPFDIICLPNLCQLMSIKWYLIIVLIYISQIISDVGHLPQVPYHLGFLFYEQPVYTFTHLSVRLPNF